MHDPDTYRTLNIPQPRDAANVAITAFLEEVSAARLKHRITDVHCIVQVPVMYADGEGLAFLTAHMGAVSEAEMMCARALGSASAERLQYVNRQVAGGRRSRKDKS